ncbi:MAG: thiol-disulfide oxidoreductase DCC family protein [Longimicrobiales bacterium]
MGPTQYPGGRIADGRPIMLFDGVCNLCNGFVLWLIDRDPSAHLTYGSLQWESAREAVHAADPTIDFDALPDSIVLIDSGGVHTRSTAALRIARVLGFPYRVLGALLIVPPPLRNWAYDFIAKRRYRWFGQKEVCMVPTPALKARFLDAEDSDSS